MARQFTLAGSKSGGPSPGLASRDHCLHHSCAHVQRAGIISRRQPGGDLIAPHGSYVF